MLNDREKELIELYFSGELGPDDQEIFDEKFKNHADFKQEILCQSNLLAGLDAIKKNELKKEIKELFTNNEIPQISTVTKRLNPIWYWAAAAVIVPLAVTLFIINQSDDPSSDELFITYFEPIDNIVSTRDGSMDSTILKGMDFYDRAIYDSASFHLSKSEEKNYMTKLYLGISQLALGNLNESINTFSAIENNSSNKLLIEYAQWFTAMVYLKKGDLKTAKKILETFRDKPSSDYYSEARELLKVL